jgi:hypothetical protein
MNRTKRAMRVFVLLFETMESVRRVRRGRAGEMPACVAPERIRRDASATQPRFSMGVTGRCAGPV